MPGNIVEGRKFLFFRTVRVILNDEFFLRLISQKNYSYVVAISHTKIDVPASVAVKTKKTSCVDLQRSPEEILQSFHDTTRNEVRRTFSIPDFSFTCNDERFKEAYSMYKEFRRKKNLEIQPPLFFRSVLRFSAYLQGRLMAVVTCYDADPYLRIQNIFSAFPHNVGMQKYIGIATRRLIYDVCVYGSKKGRTYLDMASINLHNPAKKGITNFKLSFGGTIMDEYTYTYKSAFMRLLGSFRNIVRVARNKGNST